MNSYGIANQSVCLGKGGAMQPIFLYNKANGLHV